MRSRRPKIEDQIRFLINRGMTADEIAHELHVTPHTVRQKMIEFGLREKAIGRPQVLGEAEVTQMVESYRRGMSLDDLSRGFLVKDPLYFFKRFKQPSSRQALNLRYARKHQAEIIAEYQAGTKVTEISKKHHLKGAQIFHLLDRAGVYQPYAIQNKIKEDKEKIIAAYQAGTNLNTIASWYKLASSNPISTALEKWGIRKRPHRPQRIVLTPEKEEQFRNLWNQRIKIVNIAKQLGWSDPTVDRMARRLKLPPKHSDEIEWRREVNQEILELYGNGLSTEAISAKLGGMVSAEYVRKTLHRKGVEMKTRGGWTMRERARKMRKIRKLYKKGVPLKDIQRRLNISKLHSFLNEMRIKRRRQHHRPPLSPEEVEKGLRYYAGGLRNVLITKILGATDFSYHVDKLYQKNKVGIIFFSNTSNRWKFANWITSHQESRELMLKLRQRYGRGVLTQIRWVQGGGLRLVPSATIESIRGMAMELLIHRVSPLRVFNSLNERVYRYGRGHGVPMPNYYQQQVSLDMAPTRRLSLEEIQKLSTKLNIRKAARISKHERARIRELRRFGLSRRAIVEKTGIPPRRIFMETR